MPKRYVIGMSVISIIRIVPPNNNYLSHRQQKGTCRKILSKSLLHTPADAAGMKSNFQIIDYIFPQSAIGRSI